MDILHSIANIYREPRTVIVSVCAGVTGFCVGMYAYDKWVEHREKAARKALAVDLDDERDDSNEWLVECDEDDEWVKIRVPDKPEPEEGHRKVHANRAMPRPRASILDRNDMQDVIDYTAFVTRKTVQDPDVKRALDERYADALDLDTVRDQLAEAMDRRNGDTSPHSKRDALEPDPDETYDETKGELDEVHELFERQAELEQRQEDSMDWVENMNFAERYWLDEYDMEMSPNMAGLLALQWDETEGHLLAIPKVQLPEREINVPPEYQTTSERFKVIDEYDYRFDGKDYLGKEEMVYWPLDDKLFFTSGDQPEVCVNEGMKDKVRGLWERRAFEQMFLRDLWDDMDYRVIVYGIDSDERINKYHRSDKYGWPGAWALWWAEEIEDKLCYFERPDGTRGYIAVKDRSGLDYGEEDLFSKKAIEVAMEE